VALRNAVEQLDQLRDGNNTRANLVGIARQRAELAHGQDYEAGQTILIGDAPNDVVAALNSGARIIAVVTGKDSATDLAAAGAEIVLTDLTDTQAVRAAILRGKEMTFGQSPHATPDRVIRQAQRLLISFDGPIRSVSTGQPAPHINDVLITCRESGRSVANRHRGPSRRSPRLPRRTRLAAPQPGHCLIHQRSPQRPRSLSS